MSLSEATPLKRLSRDLQPGTPVGRNWLAQRGISPQLAYRYVKGGWLEQVARGVFAKPGTPLEADPSLRLLLDMGHRIHVGGKTALAWHGYRHNLAADQEPLALYRRGRRPLPPWFAKRFHPRVNARSLFSEAGASPRYVSASAEHDDVPASDPERAALEMLSEVPARQGLEEAGHLMEGLVTLRRDPLHDLLAHCTNRKTVMLFFHFARKFDLPVLAHLSAEQLPAHSKNRYVLKLPRGTLAMKP